MDLAKRESLPLILGLMTPPKEEVLEMAKKLLDQEPNGDSRVKIKLKSRTCRGFSSRNSLTLISIRFRTTVEKKTAAVRRIKL